MQLNSNLFRATLSGALAGLLFGFDTVVISGVIGALGRLYGLDPREVGRGGLRLQAQPEPGRQAAPVPLAAVRITLVPGTSWI